MPQLPAVAPQHPSLSIAEDSIKHAALPAPPPAAALSQPLSGLTDQDLVPQRFVAREPLYTGGLQPLHGEDEKMNSIGKRLPWKSDAATN